MVNHHFIPAFDLRWTPTRDQQIKMWGDAHTPATLAFAYHYITQNGQTAAFPPMVQFWLDHALERSRRQPSELLRELEQLLPPVWDRVRKPGAGWQPVPEITMLQTMQSVALPKNAEEALAEAWVWFTAFMEAWCKKADTWEWTGAFALANSVHWVEATMTRAQIKTLYKEMHTKAARLLGQIR